MRRILPILAFGLVLVLSAPVPAHAGRVVGARRVRLDVLAPTTIVDTSGTHTGSVGALAERDESGTNEDPSKEVRFDGPSAAYVGYRTYTVPAGVARSSISTIELTANLRGPTASQDPWTWSIWDATHARWVRLGDQDHCGGNAGTKQWPCDDLRSAPWKDVRYVAIHAPGGTAGDFVAPGTRQVRIRLRASSPGAAALDQEAVEVYSEHGRAPIWTPRVRTRWQWQLQASPGHDPATNGIDLGICARPYGGGPCVRPQVFDIDLLVDPSIAGRFGYVVNTAAVRAIHASHRHVIGYVTAGDAERWRPDYEQFVDLDRRCGGCLLGKPFSKVFPDEYWANIEHTGFMLQMLRARTDRVAAAGFDGIEYDIVDTYAQGASATGFHVSARTQLFYDRSLAAMAHADGLSVALKNDGGQIPQLLRSFDYAINEQCFQYHECDGGGYPAPAWRAFVRAGKPVFQTEYRLRPSAFCPQANAWGFSSILKAKDFSLYARPWTPCR